MSSLIKPSAMPPQAIQSQRLKSPVITHRDRTPAAPRYRSARASMALCGWLLITVAGTLQAASTTPSTLPALRQAELPAKVASGVAVKAVPGSGPASKTSALPGFPHLGRSATPAELAAWDIDVRPDWQGLPPGAGSVAQGQQIWDTQCASCHGTFGESNQVFTPIVGGTTATDIATGRVAALANNSQPQRTTMMKLATLSTLWDYIRRAMPWNAPKSLKPDQVYAVTAYILNLADIVPENFVLNQTNIAEVQQRLPNRHGLMREHGLWQIDGKPDVQSIACMYDCGPLAQVRSSLPESARNAHGNLALQNRPFGAVRGIDTATGTADNKRAAPVQATATQTSSAQTPSAPANVASGNADGKALATRYGCLGCHHAQQKLVGPSFAAIAAKYPDDSSSLQALATKVAAGSSGVWGEVPMPQQNTIPGAELNRLLQWILQGAP